MDRPQQATDEALVRRALEGDREAFGGLVRRYERQAFASALSFLGDEGDAWDIVQDAFLAAYCKLSQLRQPERFGGWLRGIVRSLCLQHSRKQRSGPALAQSTEHSADVAASLAHMCYEEAEQGRTLWEAVAELPQIYREAVLLRYEGGLSYREIADALDLPVSTVKGRLQQGHLKLRKALVPEEEIIMKRESVHDDVMEGVCRIAREEIRQEIPLGKDRRVVLYCFVPASIHVTGTDGDTVAISGEKLAVGHTEQEARANLSEMRIRSDEVEDWTVAGPHAGEVFCGTNTDEAGNPSAIVRPVSGLAPKGCHSEKETLGSLYSEMQLTVREALNEARDRMRGSATRITLLWQHLKDIVVGSGARDKVWEAFPVRFRARPAET